MGKKNRVKTYSTIWAYSPFRWIFKAVDFCIYVTRDIPVVNAFSSFGETWRCCGIVNNVFQEAVTYCVQFPKLIDPTDLVRKTASILLTIRPRFTLPWCQCGCGCSCGCGCGCCCCCLDGIPANTPTFLCTNNIRMEVDFDNICVACCCDASSKMVPVIWFY